MTLKDKFILGFLTVITLGIYLIFIYKKRPQAAASALSESEKITVDIAKLKELLGNNNIVGVEYTHTKVKLFIRDKALVKVDEIQHLRGVSGIFATSKFITIIVGNQAKKIAALL